jgi:hypothetical protein
MEMVAKGIGSSIPAVSICPLILAFSKVCCAWVRDKGKIIRIKINA